MDGISVSSTHPLLPPTSEDDRLLWLRLLRSRRVGPATFFRLMGEDGTATGALKALPDVARAAGVRDYSPCPPAVAQAELRAGQKAGARLIFWGERAYPRALATLTDPPPALWAAGESCLTQKPCIAIVGARNASSLGTRMARRLARELGEAGFVVVSGLARGIDTSAHLGALDSGTIAVMAGGVDILYPSENSRLGEDIGRQGLRLSEQPMGRQPVARHFPQRNRIVSGLARAVIVVEAAAKSGSLITARLALDQGREVMAVPGHPFDARASGCNMLLRDGARLVRGADDVIEALGAQAEVQEVVQPALPLNEAREAEQVADSIAAQVPPPPPEKRTLRETAELHSQILARLGPSPIAEDQLLRDLAAPAAAVAPVLVDLELDGKVERRAGGLLARIDTGH